jgi:hypothetical protein
LTKVVYFLYDEPDYVFTITKQFEYSGVLYDTGYRQYPENYRRNREKTW